MEKYGLIINGKKVVTEKYFDVINPSTLQVVGRCPAAEKFHLDKAVDAAQKAFFNWSSLDDRVRAESIRKIADTLEDNKDELMYLLTKEVGKPLSGFHGIGSGMEVEGAIAWTRATAELKLSVTVVQDNDEAYIEVYRKPLGVVGSITPWNWPLTIATWHMMPALRTGNTVVIKPSSLTPLTTLRFVELICDILPPGVLNVVSAEKSLGNAIGSASRDQQDCFYRFHSCW